MDARHLRPDELHVGLKAEFEREITDEDVLAFARLSGDANPLHVNPEYASGTNYQGRIVHGAFQVGLASAMVGMYLPGRDVLLGSVTSRFAAPAYYPCRLRVLGEITSWHRDTRSGTVRVRVVDIARGVETASIYMGVTLHEQKADHEQRAERAPVHDAPGTSDRPVVIVTGASGGIGEQLVTGLLSQFQIIGVSRRASLPSEVTAGGRVDAARVDFEGPDWEPELDAALRNRPLYGIVHAAWPSAPAGGLLEVEEAVLEQQVRFGALQTVRLARYLYQRCSGPGRMVVLGTTAGTMSPLLSLASYSLGKVNLEHAVRLLAPELARKQITINAVMPPFIPVGINKAKTERVILKETAKVPMGRLCSTDDVVGAIAYLLSPAASFVSGQPLALTGGQL